MKGYKKLHKFIGFIIFFILVWEPFALTDTNLQYQDRGNRHEGIKPKPVSGYDIELISVLVDYEDEVKHLPDELKVKFYLERPFKVYLTVREIDYKYYYWLDKAQPQKPWHSGFDNVFKWPTDVVLKHLRDIKTSDLGVIVRLGKSEPTIDERVAPAVLYHSKFPTKIRGYLFTFKSNGDAHLSCSIYIYMEKKTRPVFNQDFRRLRGGRPSTVSWNSVQAVEGYYELVFKGYFLDNNVPFKKNVVFYHKPFVD